MSGRELRRLLGPLDPAAGDPLVPDEDRRADLRRIVATGVPHRAARRRRPLLAAGVAAAVLLVAVVGYEVVPRPEPALAATPVPLAYAGGGGNAVAVLDEIAARAEKMEKAPSAAGDYEHLVTQSWYLWATVGGDRVRSAVVPARTESWRGADNSGRIATRHDEPEFPPGSSRVSWLLNGADGLLAGTHTENYPAGAYPAGWPGRPPATGFAAWLAIGHPAGNGPAETFVAATDLVRERLLRPAERAQLLRTLATLPGLRYEGAVTSRTGRRGVGFSLVSHHDGLPTRFTLIVDPATGMLLGFEEMLTETAGRLDVRVPAVIGYEAYETAELTGKPE